MSRIIGKQKKRQKAPMVDLSRRAEIVIEPISSDSSVNIVAGERQKYNYDFIIAGINPTREERRNALKMGFHALYDRWRPWK